jgi:hypothetical protein
VKFLSQPNGRAFKEDNVFKRKIFNENIVLVYLTIFCERFEDLVDECHVILVDVEAEKAEAAGRRAADHVQQDQGLRYQVVLRLVPFLFSF